MKSSSDGPEASAARGIQSARASPPLADGISGARGVGMRMWKRPPPLPPPPPPPRCAKISSPTTGCPQQPRKPPKPSARPPKLKMLFPLPAAESGQRSIAKAMRQLPSTDRQVGTASRDAAAAGKEASNYWRGFGPS
mmetsp:Transcript_45478/g.120129  ORF Transcript_45478/g.120129 Transcript_45478/m.120129 type:complete len:137 (+) Transcript_45478:808-1218(+)